MTESITSDFFYPIWDDSLSDFLATNIGWDRFLTLANWLSSQNKTMLM